MKRNLTVGAIVVVLVAAIGAWFARGAKAENASPYRTGQITMGTVESTVTSTGRLTAIQSVAVGTQVSGMVIELHADYNDRVREGQLLAKIDPILQEQSLRNAEASLLRVKAALDQAIRDSIRSKTLYDQQIITESEMDNVNYSLLSARANLTSAEVSREQAARNLEYTSIYSPIDGVVVERNVEIGQTVAASMSAPQLYLLATDLKNIEILANVDESDIGLVRAGMPVRFTVSAYPNDSFQGVVRQIRLASSTSENVVKYTAVIAVDNSDLRLAPGMTAEVDFIAERAENVFVVPNAALRFRPTDEMIAQLTDSAMIGIARGGGRPMMGMAGAGGPPAGAIPAGAIPAGADGPPAAAPSGDAATQAPAGPPAGANGQRPAGMPAGVPNGAGAGGRPAGGNGARPAGMPAGAGGFDPSQFQRGAGGAPNFAGAQAAAPQAQQVPEVRSPAVTTAGSNGVFVLGGGAPTTAGSRPGVAPLWYIKDGKLGVIQVLTGISDGTNTEISAPELEEGMEIIIGLNSAQPTVQGGATTNPFQQQQRGGGFGGPGGGMPAGGMPAGGGGFGGGGGRGFGG